MKGGIAVNSPRNYIVSFESMTHAQKARSFLSSKGYNAEVVRAGSCGFGVSVYGRKDEISALLAAAGLRVKGIE